MSYMPRWARKQMMEQKLSHVLHNDYADQADVRAAETAIEQELDYQDREIACIQAQKVSEYRDEL